MMITLCRRNAGTWDPETQNPELVALDIRVLRYPSSPRHGRSLGRSPLQPVRRLASWVSWRTSRIEDGHDDEH